MKKLVPDALLTDREQVRLSALSMRVLDHGATEIVMTERQLAASSKQLRSCPSDQPAKTREPNSLPKRGPPYAVMVRTAP